MNMYKTWLQPFFSYDKFFSAYYTRSLFLHLKSMSFRTVGGDMMRFKKLKKKARTAKKQKNKNERMMLISLVLSALSLFVSVIGVFLMSLQLVVAIIALFYPMT